MGTLLVLPEFNKDLDTEGTLPWTSHCLLSSCWLLRVRRKAYRSIGLLNSLALPLTEIMPKISILLEMRILAAKLSNSDLDLAADCWVGFFLCFFQGKRPPKKNPPKNPPKKPPQNSPGNLFGKIPLAFLQKPSLDECLPREFSVSSTPTTEFAQPRLSRAKWRRSNTPKFVASHLGNTRHIGTNTPKFVPSR